MHLIVLLLSDRHESGGYVTLGNRVAAVIWLILKYINLVFRATGSQLIGAPLVPVLFLPTQKTVAKCFHPSCSHFHLC